MNSLEFESIISKKYNIKNKESLEFKEKLRNLIDGYRQQKFQKNKNDQQKDADIKRLILQLRSNDIQKPQEYDTQKRRRSKQQQFYSFRDDPDVTGSLDRLHDQSKRGHSAKKKYQKKQQEKYW
ncbi:UNKNOWN [Stylonychia lemnae]|uniref:Uncharacterized protein n=1 Tax=Stylonychia lemnae TaxID=5949 RepID=A0A077ZUS5_STYLE|nr:UNKNOWN [Stylonychia lemnae]|eukprot:CDW73294.1 UNKNOWN [Stylonychia lemnae]